MKLESLTEMLPEQCQQAGLYVSQEGGEVYLMRRGRIAPLACFKGSDPWSFENLLGAANLALTVTFKQEVER